MSSINGCVALFGISSTPHPHPPRMKEPLMTPRVSPLNHVDLPVSMQSFALLSATPPTLPSPPLSGAVSGAETRVAALPPQPPFKRLNLGIANAYLENTVSRSQIIADGLRLRVDACRFHKSTEANTVKSPRRHRKKKKSITLCQKTHSESKSV